MIRAWGWRCTLCAAGVIWFAAAQAQTPGPASTPAAPATESASAEEAPFDVWEFQVDGSALLSPVQVERAVMPHLGANKKLADVEQAREALEAAYRAAGYPTVFVDIPEQDVSEGVVRLHVTEGRVRTMNVTGARYFSPFAVSADVGSLAEGQVPYLPAVQQQIAAVNARTPDRMITPVLRPGRTPGTLDVELKVQDELPLHGTIEVNNRYTEGTSQSRINASLRYDNLFQRQHSLSVQYQNSPEKTEEVRVVAGTYLARFEDSNNLGVVYAVHSESDTATVGSLAVIGNGDIVGVRGIVPLPATGSVYHSVSGGVDFKDFAESVELQGADATNTPIDYIPWTVQYSATRQTAPSTVRFEAGLVFGLRGVGDDMRDCEVPVDRNNDGTPEIEIASVNEFECKRSGAKPNYMKWLGTIGASGNVVAGAQWSALLNAQLADSPLISNEQFAAGGASSVRGYFESQVLGDQGWSAQLEMRSASFAPRAGEWTQDLRALVFVDGAQLMLRQPIPGQIARSELYSAGIGARATAWKRWNATADWAYPLHAQGTVERGEQRWHASVEYRF